MAIRWYGPLIDLSMAASHVGDYVQLLVFVHRSTPVQYKLSKGREVIRTDIQVGDDTCPFFSVTIWLKQMGSMAIAGDIVLLENVKIATFQNIIEARTVMYSSLQLLVHPYESVISKGYELRSIWLLIVPRCSDMKQGESMMHGAHPGETGVDDIAAACRVGVRTREKLRKVIKWVQRFGPSLNNVTLHGDKRQGSKNWKVHEEKESQECFSLLEVSHLSESRKAKFTASIGEIFLPMSSKNPLLLEEERMFISRRLYSMGNKNLVEDFICCGCQLCEAPLNSELGFASDVSSMPLYCLKSSTYQHQIGSIYRPFMLYVWDDLKYIPLLVKDKAAEILFGNIKAEKVMKCYRRKRQLKEICDPAEVNNAADDNSDPRPSLADMEEKGNPDHNTNLYLIWLILLRVLIQQGKNSRLKFKVSVNLERDAEEGRFEMISVSMPCNGGTTLSTAV